MTLTQAAIFTKRFLIFSVIALILSIGGFVGYKIWYARYLASLPPIEIKPDTSFGILPVPNLGPSIVSPTNFSYSIDTETGNLPTFEIMTKVFFLPKTVATLLSGDKSQTIADKLNLTVAPEVISETRYRYTQDNRSLLIDLDTGNFVYLAESTPAAQGATISDEPGLVQDFKNLLASMGILHPELQNGPSKILYYRALDNLVPIETIKEAQVAEISIWHQNVEEKPIYTNPYNKSLVKAIVVTSAREATNYLSLNYTYWPVDTSTFATYPLKTADQALDDLKAGLGVVVVDPQKPNVSITAVSLTYFQSENYTPYMQPIYVFEGPGFVAYVPAIISQYLEQPVENNSL